MIDFNIGILGAGHIAGVAAETIAKLDGFRVAAVAARDKARADEFAAKYEIEKAYGDYDELLNDPEKTKVIKGERYGEKQTVRGYKHLCSVSEEMGGQMISGSLKKG